MKKAEGRKKEEEKKATITIKMSEDCWESHLSSKEERRAWQTWDVFMNLPHNRFFLDLQPNFWHFN